MKTVVYYLCLFFGLVAIVVVSYDSCAAGGHPSKDMVRNSRVRIHGSDVSIMALMAVILFAVVKKPQPAEED